MKMSIKKRVMIGVIIGATCTNGFSVLSESFSEEADYKNANVETLATSIQETRLPIVSPENVESIENGLVEVSPYWSTQTITGVTGKSTTLKFFNDDGKLNWTEEQSYINSHTSHFATAINCGSWTDKYEDYIIGHNPGAGGNLFVSGISYTSSGKSDGSGYKCNIVGKTFKISSSTFKISSVSLINDNAIMISTSSTAGTFKKGFDFWSKVIAPMNSTKRGEDVVFIQTCKTGTENWIIRGVRQ